jgi:hypothetical protein
MSQVAISECVPIANNCAPNQPDIKSLQIQLTGFLDKDTGKFCKDLWSLCLSAQQNPQGVAKEILEAKKLELIQEKVGLTCPANPRKRHFITDIYLPDRSRKGCRRGSQEEGAGASARARD